MSAGRVWAVVPVKPFRAAKARLAKALTSAERPRLARAMFEDVLSTVEGSDHLAGLIVLTADDEVAALAWRYGARVLAEAAPVGLNAGIACAIDHLAGAPDAGMLVIPADLPQISVGAIEQAVRLLDAPRAVALLAATVDGGTNLLACRPAGVIRPRFGPHSFDRHRQAACEAGIVPSVLTWPGLGQDIDRPDDLAAFLSLGTATRTHAYLSGAGIAERLGPLHRDEKVHSYRAFREDGTMGRVS